MKELRQGFSKMTQTEKVQTAANLAGLNAQSGLLAIVNASEEKFNQLTDAVYNASGAAKEMAKTRMDTLQGSMLYLQSAAEGVKIAFGDKLGPYLRKLVDWVTSKMPQIKEVMLDIADSIGNTVDKVTNALNSMMESSEWQNADGLWEKAKVAWDRLIAEPFDEWWNSKGQSWLTEKAGNLGKGLGSFITAGLSAILGENSVSAVDGGLTAGKSIASNFMKGLSEGIDWSVVINALKNAFEIAIKAVFSNPLTGTTAAAWIGSKALSGVSGAINMAAGAKGLWSTASGLTGSVGMSAPAAGAFIGGSVAGIAGGIAGAVTLGSATHDLWQAHKIKSESGDAREQQMYNESAARKIGGVAAGAAIGSVIMPGVGTFIGAGIGAIAGNIGSAHAKKKYEKAVAEEKEAEAAALLAREQAKYASKDLKDALKDTSVSAEEFDKMFQDKVISGLKSGFGDVKVSLEDISDMARHITFGDAEMNFKRFSSAAAKAKEDFAGLSDTAETLKKLNWKGTLAYEGQMKWTEEDNTQFIQAAESMVSQAKKYIEDKHFEAQMAVNIIFGENSETGAGIMEGLGGMYAELQGQVDEYAKQISIILKNEKGLLTFEKQQEVNNLLNQIAEITNMISDTKVEAKVDRLTLDYGGGEMDFDSFTQFQQKLSEFMDEQRKGIMDSYEVLNLQIQLRAQKDPNYDSTADLAELEENTRKQIQDSFNHEIEINLDKISIAIGNEEGINIDNILPNLEGDLSERLSTALTDALKVRPDFKSWDTDYWMKILGLENNAELAGQLQTLLTPVVQTISKGFSGEIKEAAKKEAEEAMKAQVDAYREQVEKFHQEHPQVEFKTDPNNPGKSTGQSAVEGIAEEMTPDKAAAILESGIENVKSGFSKTVEDKADEFKEVSKPIGQSAVEGIAEGMTSEESVVVFQESAGSITSGMSAAVQEKADEIKEASKPAGQSAVEGVAEGMTSEESTAIMQSGVENAASGMGAVIQENSDTFKEAGKPAGQSAAEGIAEGMMSEETAAAVQTGIENIKTYTDSAVQNSLDSFKETMKPLSQSTVEGFVGELGSETTSGLLMQGMETFRFLTETAAQSNTEAFLQVLKPSAQSMLQGFLEEITSKGAETAQSAFESFKSSVESAFSQDIEVNVNVSVNSNTNGYSDDGTKHANGGILTHPHFGLVAEDGAEAIIPLSGKRRSRGISLWERAGRLLGVRKYANGGIVGKIDDNSFYTDANTDDFDLISDNGLSNNDMSEYAPAPIIPTEQSVNAPVSVPVTIGNVTFEIHADGGNTDDIVRIIKNNVKNLTDEIAHDIALSMRQVFENMPMA